MRIITPGEKLSKSELRYFAKMAGRAYLNDPVHSFATKSESRREKFVSHFMMERLNTSNGEDWFFIDDERRGICVLREAHNEYTAFDFLKCIDWVYLFLHLPQLIRTLAVYGALDVNVFTADTWIISPVFVDPAHQGKGVAAGLINEAVRTMREQGLKVGLEAQSDSNVRYYEKLGFKTTGTAKSKVGGITHTYMVKE